VCDVQDYALPQADTLPSSLSGEQWPTLNGKTTGTSATLAVANDQSVEQKVKNVTSGGTSNEGRVTVPPVTPPRKAKTKVTNQRQQMASKAMTTPPPTRTPVSMMMMPTSVILSQKKKKEVAK
jgi:hypothetical protein